MMMKHYGYQNIKSQSLPIIFANPKIHKTPPAFRFIVAAKNSSIKPLEETCKMILAHYTQHFRNYCGTIVTNMGQNRYVSVNDSHSVVSKLKKIDKINEIFTGDFSALYPSLKHSTIVEGISRIVDMCHKNSKAEFLRINEKRIRYAHDNSNGTLHKDEIKQMCQDILQHSYMNFAGINFITIQGTPQGGSASCAMADLALSWAEYKWLDKHPLKKDQLLCRYVDDLLAINMPDFHQTAKLIYSSELLLNDTTISATESNFLDLHIEIQNHKPIIKLYNKTDDYSFQIIRYFKYSSNVPSQLPYGVLEGQILRFLRLTNLDTEFWSRLENLINEYCSNGFPKYSIIKRVLKTIHK